MDPGNRSTWDLYDHPPNLKRLSVVQNPLSTGSEQVFKVEYPRGSYSPAGSHDSGGVHFYTKPFGHRMFKKAMLSYDIGFPYDFIWVEGGKLPGVFAGDPSHGCSGGRESNGINCFSTRLMWRANGVGEVYDYLPRQENGFCSQEHVVCNEAYGTSLGRDFKFGRGWNQVQLFVQVNDPDQNNGIVELYLNNTLVYKSDTLRYRNTDDLGVSYFMFSSFFGGSEPRFATPVNTQTYFRNIQLSVGEEIKHEHW
ncbi:hypothetical protein K493DRAFT_239879 [Basidiobolus meristosporus CBS 931.73]|uniref:Polysaccharide lyase 14 domain-containing protein n=1 Tax=Basidiobolus meristosporus CBS 931.73 TaxID=1314790 RepID=A0A1Y1XD17_9FUNG|nr:hypothetical protein K493DRAFT_239879 [Basidiobolus meristosporus CBS 931.73]|eukprot:ORX83638.1 hypothetical protein K493DRAFT_239879 [Basidiobolus meristosporus CBS 931.73]